MSLWNELKRRKVIRVAIAYAIVAWLLLQISDTLVPALHLPDWFRSGVALVLIMGFPIALIFAWAFELTPEGLKKEKDVDRGELKSPDGDDKELSIAVLPFVNMSEDSGNEYFSDGLAEELLNLLTRIPELRVAARTSSFSFKKQADITIAEIARTLGVASILEGSVRKSGEQVRITAQLINAENGFHLWSETFDRKLDNIFDTQDEIAAAVTAALKITLLGEAPSCRRTDPLAYQLYLEGQHLVHRGDMESLESAMDLFRQALDVDARYAPAWSELASCYFWYTAYGGMAIDEGNALASEYVEKALAIDEHNARAYFVRGLIRSAGSYDFAGGAEDYQRAEQLEPGNADFVMAASFIPHNLGRIDEALDKIHKAIELDPLSPRLHSFLGIFSFSVGRFEDAEAAFRKTLTLNPRFPGGRYRLSRVLIRQGRAAQALEEAQREAGDTYRLTGLVMVQHALGNSEAAAAAMTELIQIAATEGAFQIAEANAAMGDLDNALDWLNKSWEYRDSGLTTVLGEASHFRELHADPRWTGLLDRMGLLDAWQAMPPEWGGPAV